ncbi:MAG: SWIM zinc finger family protein [Comamonadaceae bacterium]|nr:SWIM zinc finger family protein [Comamonadaceae bacterium]
MHATTPVSSRRPRRSASSCSCPDWASMCKHVAAVLYGVGARLDEQPELIFRLRRVDAKDLVSQAGAGLPKSSMARPPARCSTMPCWPMCLVSRWPRQRLRRNLRRHAEDSDGNREDGGRQEDCCGPQCVSRRKCPPRYLPLHVSQPPATSRPARQRPRVGQLCHEARRRQCDLSPVHWRRVRWRPR